MLSTELIRKIRQIEIRTRHLVNDSFAGEYQSVFKGRGMEFNEVRPYVPGDEIRDVDWNVTARMGTPFVKRFVEERELTVMVIVDASGSNNFGSVSRFKQDLAAEMTAVLAFAATTNNDRVGLLTFTDQIELFIPPRKGRKHVLRIIRELLAFRPSNRRTDVKMALETINRVLKRRGVIFLVSDFLVDPESYSRALAVTNRRHDVVAVELHDPLEMKFPDVGVVALEDAESGEIAWIDTGHQQWRRSFNERTRRLAEARKELLNRTGVDRIVVTTTEDYVSALTRFFQKRARRLAR